MEAPRDPIPSAEAAGPAPGPGRLEPSAVSALFEAHGPELFRMALAILRDPDQAQDALQATFIKALERGHTASLDTIRGWLFRVAAREALALRRSRQRQIRHEQAFAWLGQALDARQADAEDPLVCSERLEAVREAMAQLPPSYLAVVQARIFEDKTFARIAQEQGLPLGTVLTRMRRALQRLSQALRDEDER